MERVFNYGELEIKAKNIHRQGDMITIKGIRNPKNKDEDGNKSN